MKIIYKRKVTKEINMEEEFLEFLKETDDRFVRLNPYLKE